MENNEITKRVLGTLVKDDNRGVQSIGSLARHLGMIEDYIALMTRGKLPWPQAKV